MAKIQPWASPAGYWLVGRGHDDALLIWGGTEGAYVQALPAGWYMSLEAAAALGVDDDAVVSLPSRVATEEELSAYLAELGARGPLVLTDAVDVERDRRIAAGFVFNGVLFQSRPQDQKRISGAATLAIAATLAGAQPADLRWHGEDYDFAWIAADNSTVPMDAPTVLLFGAAAANWEAVHVYAGRALKDVSPIPSDYAADSYWPTT